MPNVICRRASEKKTNKIQSLPNYVPTYRKIDHVIMYTIHVSLAWFANKITHCHALSSLRNDVLKRKISNIHVIICLLSEVDFFRPWRRGGFSLLHVGPATAPAAKSKNNIVCQQKDEKYRRRRLLSKFLCSESELVKTESQMENVFSINLILFGHLALLATLFFPREELLEFLKVA